MRKLISFALSFQSLCSFAQVNLQTGASQINIPLFSYSDNNGLSCNINLGYFDGNGLKVSEIASSVGTGWNLQLGGVITREQRGLPDDQKRDPSIQNPLPTNLNMTYDEYYNKYFPNGYLFSAYSPSDVITNEGGYTPTFAEHLENVDPPIYPFHMAVDRITGANFANPTGTNIPIKESIAADREQDIFHLNYGNGTADFVIGKNGQIKVLNDSRIKISMVQTNYLGLNIKTCISAFYVTDLQGIQYIFSATELSQTCKSETSYTTQGTFQMPTFIGIATPNFIVTKWYLSEILNTRTNKGIFFGWESTNLDMLTQRGVNDIVQTGHNDQTSVFVSRSVIKCLRIKSINLPSATINFVYDMTSRVDAANQNVLKEIQINDKNNNYLLKKYVFTYGYFFQSEIKPYTYQFSATDVFFARLCLQSLREIGSDNLTSKPPYLFAYYTGDGINYNIVPPTSCFWTDHWGFYNAHTFGIHHPTFYQPNQVPISGEISDMCVNASTVRAPVNAFAQNGIIKQISYPLGGTLTYEYEQNDASFSGQNIAMGGVRVKRTLLYNATDHGKDIIKEYKYLKNDEVSSSGWGYETPTYSVTKVVRNYRGSSGKLGVSFVDYVGRFVKSSIASKLTSVVNAGYSDGVGSLSSPSTQGPLLQLFVQVLAYLFTPSDPDYIDQSETFYSSTSIQSSNPLPFQYSRVEEINKTLISDIGKTVYEFTSDQNRAIDIFNFPFPFSNKDRYVPWAYGLPTRIAVYNNASTRKMLKETIYDYNFIASFMTDANFMSKKWEANKLVLDAFPPGSSSYLAQFGNITEAAYYPQIGHTELADTKERIYNKNDNGYQENLNTYTYNSYNFQPKTITSTNSKGEILQRKIYYPEDYTSNGFISTLITNNMVSVPLCSETWITKGSAQPQLIDAASTEFSVIGNGDIKPFRTYTFESTGPVAQNVLLPFNPSSVVRDVNYIKQQQQYVYDNSGSLIQSISKAKNTSILYDYDNSLVTLNILNANTDEFAYTSFEAENPGRWIYNTANINTQISPTGNKCYQLSAGNNVTTSISISKAYTLSFWSSGSNVQVNGSFNPTKVVNIISGWTYYEFQLSLGAPSPVISGTAMIDEIRLSPKDSRMTTYTFDILKNKTSECDVNNRILYYKYDALGRITLILDETQNIIKAFEYNSKQ